MNIRVVVMIALFFVVAAVSADPDFTKSIQGSSVSIEDGTAHYISPAGEAKITLHIDGEKFKHSEKKSVGESEYAYQTGEKYLYIIDSPEVYEQFDYTGTALEESVTIRQKRQVSYNIDVPDDSSLVRTESGDYRIYNPMADTDKDGYLVIRKAWGRDADGNRVTFDYRQTGPEHLTLVWPENDRTDAGTSIKYPLYIDPLMEQTYDLKFLIHSNLAEDGNASINHFVDSSRYFATTQTGTANVSINTTAIAGGKFGTGALKSSGVAADVVWAPSSAEYNISTNNFAINMQANFTGTIGTNQTLAYGGDGSTGLNAWSFFLNNNTAITFMSQGDASASLTCRVGAISTGVWHQFTVIRNSSTNLEIYQNRTLLCNGTPAARINLPEIAGARVQVPYGVVLGSGPMTPMTGFIDEFGFWNGGQGREIADFPNTEIQMYAGQATYGGYGDDNSTVSLLHFNDVNLGTNFTDQTGKIWTRNGTGHSVSTNTSKFDGSSLFSNGAASTYLQTDDSVSDFDFGTGDWTIDFWYNTSSNITGGVFTTKTLPGTGYYVWYQGEVNRFILSANTSSTLTQNLLLTTMGLPNNSWQHIAFVRNGTSLLAFVNGTLNNSTTISAVRPFSATESTVEIGHTVVGGSLNEYSGYLDELRFSRKSRWTSNFIVPYYPYEITNASFTHSDPLTDTSYPVTVQFNDTSPDSNWTDANLYYWTFGDGNASIQRNPSHDYVSNGTYTVTFQTFNNNMTSTATDTIVIGGPVAGFSASPTTGTAALQVRFTDETINLSPITSYLLDYGDGTSTTDAPDATGGWTHVYSTYGAFSPNLTIDTAEGSDFEYKRDYIITSTDQGTQNWYSPHQVAITAVDTNHRKLPNVEINVSAIAATFPSGTNWLVDMYGVDPTLANQMLNGTLLMQGTTGSDGATVFTMLSSIQYLIRLRDPSTGIQTSVNLSPLSNSYEITMVGVASSRNNTAWDMGTNTSLYVTEPNASYVTLNLRYQDISGRTSLLEYFAVNKTNGTVINYQSTSSVGTAPILMNYTVPNAKFVQFSWYYNAVRTV